MLRANKNNELIGMIEVLLGASFFGLIPIFVRLGENINLFSLVFFRAFFGAIFIFLLMKLKNKRLQTLSFKELKKVIVWSLILLLAIVFYFYSLQLIDIASATILLNLNSVFIIAFSFILLKESIHKRTLLSLAFSVIGVIFIFGSEGNMKVNIVGYTAAIIAAFWTGLNFIYPKIQFKNYDSYSMSFYQSAFQLPFLLPLLLFNESINFTFKNTVSVLGLGFFCTALSFTLIYSGIQKTKNQYIGLLQTSETIIPIILAWLIFKEEPSTFKILGGIMIILGYVVLLFKKSSSEKTI